MHKTIARVLITAGLFLTTCSVGTIHAEEQGSSTIYEKTETELIGLGLTYEHKSKLTLNGWVDIHVLIADLEEESMSIDIVRDDETFGLRDGLSDLTTDEDKQFIGAVNGSFFNMNVLQSDIEGFEYEDGTISFAKDDYNLFYLRSANLFIYDEDSPVFDYISTDISLVTEKGASIYIVGINTTADLNNPVIFNKNAFDTTVGIDALASVYKVVVEDDVITAVVEPGTSVDIPEDGYVMTFHEDQASDIKRSVRKGYEVSLDTKTNLSTHELQLAFPGGGMILKDGEVMYDGLIVGENNRHPRTAIGLTEDQRYLVAMVVDGRRESIGATHNELAHYLKAYNVSDAMHLDGGGSSTLVARDIGNFAPTARNLPSDGYERPVVNGLGFVLNAPKTDAFNLILTSDQERVFVDNKISLSLKAADLNFNPVEVDTSQIAWSVSGGYGVLHKMEFVPKEAGIITLTANYKGESKSIDIEVIDTLIDLEVVPKVIHFEDGVQKFTVIGTDDKGHRSIINNDLLTWEISAPVGTIYEGIFRGGETPTDARIDVGYKGIKEVAYVATGEIRDVAIDLMTAGVETLLYPETVMGTVLKKIDDGQSIVTISYQFVPSEVSQAVYAVFEGGSINRNMDEIALQVTEFPEDLLVKGHLQDHDGEQYTINFDQQKDGDIIAKVPTNMTYPVKLTRIYVATLASNQATFGEMVIEGVESVSKVKEIDLDDVISIPPVDDAYELYPGPGYDIKIFGATSGRNRLLDDVVLGKVYDVFNESDFAVYAGDSTIDPSKVTNDYLVYEDAFEMVDLEEVRLITLGMSKGSMIQTDSRQWAQLEQGLASAVQDTIVFIGTEKLIDNLDEGFTKEGALIHETISNYAIKSGRNIFYINASGYAYNLSFYEGIRYIDLNGLWYKVGDDHAVDLYDSFQTVNIHVSGKDVSYSVGNLFPKTQVTD